MTRLLIDTSVLIKWFHSPGEGEPEQARALRAAHVTGELDGYMLDLAVDEVGNVLTRTLRWTAGDVADQLDDLHAILGPPLVMTRGWWRRAATFGQVTPCPSTTRWAAAAAELGIPVSADRRLLAASLAESPTQVTTRLKLSPS